MDEFLIKICPKNLKNEVLAEWNGMMKTDGEGLTKKKQCKIENGERC